MKRLIATLGLTAVALPAFALEFGAPYEQLNVDRALPRIEFAAAEPYVADISAPFEQLTLDRALPNLPGRSTQYAAAATGGTRTDANVNGGVLHFVCEPAGSSLFLEEIP